MFAWFARSHRARATAAPRSVCLRLEQLEDRLSPSTVEYLSLNVTYQPNKQVVLSGQLTTPTGPVANQTINLAGAVNGSATTDAQGNYSVNLAASQLGQVRATSADGQASAMNVLQSGTPSISNFSATNEGGGLWLFSGKVSGAPVQGEVVDFAGIPALADKSGPVNSDGTFSCYVYIANGQGGVVTAEAIDWWGDTSQDATTTVVA